MTTAPGPPSDQDVRDRVVQEIDRCCVVEAGAGTGKTTLLVDRALALLVRERATIDQIAVITFTEKAAGELKIRLRQTMERRLREDPSVRPIFQRALEGIDRAAIATIHAFAASLLRERPIEAKLDPRFVILDDLQAVILRDKVFDRIWTESLTREDPDLQPVLRLGVGRERIRTLTILAAENRDLKPPPEAPAAEPPRDALGRFRSRVGRLQELLPLCRDPDDEGLQQTRRLLRLRVGVETLDPQAARLRVLVDGRVKRTAGTQAHWENPAALREAKKIFAEMEDDRLEALARVGGAAAWHLGRFIDSFRAAYETALDALGGIDFQGLLIRTRDLLRDRLDVRADFHRRYRHLLVDEFQDTDPLQAEIVLFLAEDTPHAATWREARPGAGRLFIVGDPKQSIYRFRRADIAVYDAVRRMIEDAPTGRGERIAVNFRTVPGIIDWVNEVFGRLIGASGPGSHQPPYAPIARHRAAIQQQPAVAILPLPTSAEGRAAEADGARDVEAALVASLVRRIVEVERWPIRPKEDGERTALYRDVTLLFRGLTGLDHFEEAFRARGIPYRVIGGRAFYARQETRHMQAILRAIENPHDALSVAAALRSPFLGCSDEDLFLHVADAAAVRFDYLAHLESIPAGTPAGDALRLLHDLHQRRNDRAPADTIEELLDRTGALALLLLRPQGEQRIANLLKIADLARRHEAAGDAGFGSFVRFLSTMEEDERLEAESPTVEDDDDVVRMMTVHQAKGLEFPIVVLADAGGQTRPGDGFYADREHGLFHFSLSADGGETSFGSWGLDEAKEFEKLREAEELVRLLYVATTRARDHLVIPVVPHQKRCYAFLKLLREAGALPAGPAHGDSAAIPMPLYRMIDSTQLETVSSRAAPFRLSQLLVEEQGQADPGLLRERESWKEGLQRALREAARGRPIRTASSLEGLALMRGPAAADRGLEPAPARSATDAMRAAIGSSPERTGRKRVVGVAVHAVLEMVPPLAPSAPRERLAEAITLASREADLTSDEEQDVARLVAAAFETKLALRLARARRTEVEYPFAVLIGGPDAGAVLLEGRIDLLFEEDGGWVVVDYKTDSVPARQDVAAFVAEKTVYYKPQAAAYAAALDRLGVRVHRVLLVFLDAAREVEVPVDPAFLELGRQAILTPSAGP